MNNTNTDTDTKKLSLQHPDSVSSIDDTPPPTPVLNPKLLNTKHLSIDINTWNNFHEINNEVPTIDVSPIYANTPHVKKNFSKTNDIVQKQTIKRDQEPNHDNNVDDRSCLMKVIMYLFSTDSP